MRSPATQDAFLHLVPSSTAGTCPAPSNGGSVALGAWFLQSPIIQAGGKFYTANPDGTPNLNSPAHHVNGDLLLVANFSGGGGSGTITAYTWNNGFSATGTTLASNIGTAIVNTVPLDGVSGHPPAVPWPFTSTASGTASQYVQVGEFFEAGVDLNLLFPNLTNFNFGTFMVETRSSTSTNATLSDFILGHVSTAPDVCKNVGLVGSFSSVSSCRSSREK